MHSITNFSFITSEQIAVQNQIRYLCTKYEVVEVIKDFHISKECKAELFLLGAWFGTERIRGIDFTIIIMDKKMYILDEGNSQWVF